MPISRSTLIRGATIAGAIGIALFGLLQGKRAQEGR